ncbi:acetamidase/formamidase family protein [soil metagenome]
MPETALTDLFYQLDPDRPMAQWVDDGARVQLRTLDASGGQFVEGFEGEANRDELFPVTGPTGIRGVAAGDTVAVDVIAIAPDEYGHTWTRSGLGFASPTGYHARELSAHRPVIDWGTGPAIEVPAQVHIGTLGLLPDYSFAPRSVGVHGGNLDTRWLGAGSKIWLTAQVEGGGLFAGDVHASIGAAEVCGTGIEVAATLDLAVRSVRGWAPVLPTVRAEGRTWLIADGDSFDEALERGVRACTTLLARSWGMSVKDAYLAVGLLLQVEVCQVVNPRRSLALSLAGGADIALGPEEARA